MLNNHTGKAFNRAEHCAVNHNRAFAAFRGHIFQIKALGQIEVKLHRGQQRIPYTAIIGAKEAAEGKLTVRLKGGENTQPLPVDEVIAKMQEEVKSYSLTNLLK